MARTRQPPHGPRTPHPPAGRRQPPPELIAAVGHHRSGRLGEAEALYRQVIRQFPQAAEPHGLLGYLAHQGGHHEAAIGHTAKAIELNPRFADAYLWRGMAFQALQRLGEAEASYRKALALNPAHFDGLNNLGAVLLLQNRLRDAIPLLQQAIAINAGRAEAHYNLGKALLALGHVPDAIESFRRAVRLRPDYVEALNNLGIGLIDLGRNEEGISCLQRALALDPTRPESHFNLARAIRDVAPAEETERLLRAALELQPEYPDARGELAVLLSTLGRGSEAIEHLRYTVETSPESVDAVSALLMSLNYEPDLSADKIAAEHRQLGAGIVARCAATAMPTWSSERFDPTRRLKVGYMSPDFRAHSCASFIEPLFAARDRAQFELFVYSNTPNEDAVTQRLRDLTDHWRSVRYLDDGAVAHAIAEDRIDILVDLAGHTAGSRPAVLAMRPAPLLFTWLGYPNTTGLATVDYRITDKIADPEGPGDDRHTERLVRLPSGFLCFRPLVDAPVPRPGALDGPLVFGCFNTASKLNRRVAELWTRILAAVPESRLHLRALQFRYPAATEAARRLFIDAGLDPSRLELSPWRKTVSEALADYGAVDVGLDPFPYNGTTTTCEALWMGVPVVTLAGDAHAGRVGASLLTSVGIGDQTVARSPDDYMARAVRLAGDRDLLRRWRVELRPRMAESRLTDEAGFAREFEQALRNAWRIRCAQGSDAAGGQTPAGSATGRE